MSETTAANNDADECKVCVVIVNWNSWELLFNCVKALQQQTFKHFKVCVIDNASDFDRSHHLTNEFNDVEFIRNQKNLGFAAANNQAIHALETIQWIALLNPDTIPQSDWLENLVKATRHYPAYDVFASRLLQHEQPERLDGDGDVYHISGLVWRKGWGCLRNEDDDTPREIFSACAAAALYRNDALDAVGGFDEDFFCYVEDVDLGFRLRLKGYRCLLIPDALVSHIGSATSGGRHSDFAVYHGHRNLVWAFVKNMPSLLLIVLLPVHLALNVLSIILFTCRGQGKVILQAKKDALIGLPGMWLKRQLIQKERTISLKEIWRVLDKSMLPLGRK